MMMSEAASKCRGTLAGGRNSRGGIIHSSSNTITASSSGRRLPKINTQNSPPSPSVSLVPGIGAGGATHLLLSALGTLGAAHALHWLRPGGPWSATSLAPHATQGLFLLAAA